MNIQELTCTIEQAKKLKELGVTADTKWVAVLDRHGDTHKYCYRREDGIISDPENNERYTDGYGWTIVNTYTLGELMRILPVNALVHKSANGLHKASTIEVGIYGCKTLEQAATALLIRLLEINSLTPEQCNAALQEKGGQQ